VLCCGLQYSPSNCVAGLIACTAAADAPLLEWLWGLVGGLNLLGRRARRFVFTRQEQFNSAPWGVAPGNDFSTPHVWPRWQQQLRQSDAALRALPAAEMLRVLRRGPVAGMRAGLGLGGRGRMFEPR